MRLLSTRHSFNSSAGQWYTSYGPTQVDGQVPVVGRLAVDYGMHGMPTRMSQVNGT